MPYIFNNNLEFSEDITVVSENFGINREKLVYNINGIKQKLEKIISSSNNKRFAEPFLSICAQKPEERYLSSPIFFAWEITNECNYDCVYCSTNSSFRNPVKHSFSREKAFDIANQIIKAEIFQTFFSGGEPLKADYLPDLVNFLTREKRQVILATNAALIPSLENELWKMKDARLQVKLDSINPERYNLIVGKNDSFEEFRKGIEILSKNDMDYFFQGALTPAEISDIERIVEYAHENNAKKIKLINIIDYGRGKKLNKRWSEDQQEQILSKLSDFNKSYQDFVDYTALEIEWNKNDVLESDLYPITSCKATRSYLRLLYDGRLVPCSALRNVSLGNINDDKILDVWNSYKINSLRKNGFKCPLREKLRLELENCSR